MHLIEPARDIRLIHGDCLKQVSSLEAESIDVIMTDPPAGICLLGNTWDNPKYYDTFKTTGSEREAFILWLKDIWTQAARVLKRSGKIIVWTLPRTSHWTAKSLIDAGFFLHGEFYHIFSTGFPKNVSISQKILKITGDENLSKKWLGWGTALKPAYEKWFIAKNSSCSELFIEAAYYNKASSKDRLTAGQVVNDHPSLKNLDLMKHIVENYSAEGDTVLDLFAGSGTTGVACQALGRKFIGIEKNKDYFKIAQSRFANSQGAFEELVF